MRGSAVTQGGLCNRTGETLSRGGGGRWKKSFPYLNSFEVQDQDLVWNYYAWAITLSLYSKTLRAQKNAQIKGRGCKRCGDFLGKISVQNIERGEPNSIECRGEK